MMCSETPRPLSVLMGELATLALAVRQYAGRNLDVEEAQARTDYRGLLREICARLQLDPNRVYHPLCTRTDSPPAGIPTLC